MKLSTYISLPEHPARTQHAWAAELGISRSYLSQLLSGAKVPSVAVAKQIDAATGGRVPWQSFFEPGRADDEAAA